MSLCKCLFLPWATWAELSGGFCKTETSASCPAGKASRSTEESSLRHHRKKESEHTHRMKCHSQSWSYEIMYYDSISTDT